MESTPATDSIGTTGLPSNRWTSFAIIGDLRHRLASGSLVLLLALLTSACVERALAPVRALTYPPDFNYLTRDELHGTMADFARQMDALDRILSQEGGARPADQIEIIAILDRMRLQAAPLEEGTDSNHPDLRRDALRFARDVDRALAAARRDPPDYAWAGRVLGSCTACHAPRHPGSS
jgi:hypothetical protein